VTDIDGYQAVVLGSAAFMWRAVSRAAKSL
jgi:hypothetical protein